MWAWRATYSPVVCLVPWKVKRGGLGGWLGWLGSLFVEVGMSRWFISMRFESVEWQRRYGCGFDVVQCGMNVSCVTDS